MLQLGFRLSLPTKRCAATYARNRSARRSASGPTWCRRRSQPVFRCHLGSGSRRPSQISPPPFALPTCPSPVQLLARAIRRGDVGRVADLLLQQQRAPALPLGFGLLEAAARGHRDILEMMLEAAGQGLPQLLEAPVDARGRSALHFAAAAGDYAGASMLLARCASVDVRGRGRCCCWRQGLLLPRARWHTSSEPTAEPLPRCIFSPSASPTPRNAGHHQGGLHPLRLRCRRGPPRCDGAPAGGRGGAQPPRGGRVHAAPAGRGCAAAWGGVWEGLRGAVNPCGG